MHSVRFELTHPKISELESDALDHSATNALTTQATVFLLSGVAGAVCRTCPSASSSPCDAVASKPELDKTAFLDVLSTKVLPVGHVRDLILVIVIVFIPKIGGGGSGVQWSKWWCSFWSTTTTRSTSTISPTDASLPAASAFDSRWTIKDAFTACANTDLVYTPKDSNTTIKSLDDLHTYCRLKRQQ